LWKLGSLSSWSGVSAGEAGVMVSELKTGQWSKSGVIVCKVSANTGSDRTGEDTKTGHGSAQNLGSWSARSHWGKFKHRSAQNLGKLGVLNMRSQFWGKSFKKLHDAIALNFYFQIPKPLHTND